MKTQKCVPLPLLAAFVDAGVKHNERRAITSDSCESATALPTVTVTRAGGPGGRGPGGQYEQCYTLTCDKWCSSGLCPGTNTVTETCDDVVCRHPTATALPPGFTTAAVECATCGGAEGETLTRTLTFPIESAGPSVNVPGTNAIETQDAAPTTTGDHDNYDNSKSKPESSKNEGDASHETIPTPGPNANNEDGEDREHPPAPQEPKNEDENDGQVVPAEPTSEEHVQAGASSLAARGFGAGALAVVLAFL